MCHSKPERSRRGMGEGVLETIATEAPPLPVLCTVIQTGSDGGDAEKSGLWWGKPRESVQAKSGHLTTWRVGGLPGGGAI